MIDPNLYAGASILAIGIFFGLGTPYLIRWFARTAAHAQLKLNEKRHQQNVVQGKVKAPQQSLQTAPGTP